MESQDSQAMPEHKHQQVQEEVLDKEVQHQLQETTINMEHQVEEEASMVVEQEHHIQTQQTMINTQVEEVDMFIHHQPQVVILQDVY